MSNKFKIAQVRIVLDNLRKSDGAEAVASILKAVDAIDVDSIDPNDYLRVLQLAGHEPAMASGTMTCRADEKPTIDPVAIYARWNAPKTRPVKADELE